MKLRKQIIVSILALMFMSCSKVNNRNMVVIKDCTGTYLQFKGDDFQVCNAEKVENYENGTEVIASFKKINDCSDHNEFICELYHINKGWIIVTKIK